MVSRYRLVVFLASTMFTEEARALQLIGPSQDASSSSFAPSSVNSSQKLKISEENISLMTPCLESLAIERALANHPEVRPVMQNELNRIRADKNGR
jgi:hypothetical protein